MDLQSLTSRLAQIDVASLDSNGPPPPKVPSEVNDDDDSGGSPFLFAPPPTRHATRGQASIEPPTFRVSKSDSELRQSSSPGPPPKSPGENAFHSLFLTLDPLFSKDFGWDELFPSEDDGDDDQDIKALRKLREKLTSLLGQLNDKISLSELSSILYGLRVERELAIFLDESAKSLNTKSGTTDNTTTAEGEVQLSEQTLKESKAKIISDEGSMSRIREALQRNVGVTVQIEVGELLIRARTLYDSDRESSTSSISTATSKYKDTKDNKINDTIAEQTSQTTDSTVQSDPSVQVTTSQSPFGTTSNISEEESEVDTELEVARMVARGLKEKLLREL